MPSSELSSRSLADVLEGVEGWLSDEQAERLYRAASSVDPRGRIVEIGSFRGRSTIVLARGAEPGVELVAIDPHGGDDRGPREIRGSPARGEEDLRAFQDNLARAGVAERVRHVRFASSHALGAVTGPIDLLYVDGAHRYRPARFDLSHWGSRIAPGGTLLIHDAFSSVGVTAAILTRLAFARDFVYVGRVRSLAEYRRVSRVPARERLSSALRQLAELPWFVRNVLIKLALAAGRRGVASRLGHPPADEWPY